MRVGRVETQKVDVRIIAATNVDLKKMVAEGRFRDDLYYRLCVITISIPPLRERREDIPLLAEHFVRLYASENDKPISGIAPGGLRALLDHDWPGNVRELENAIERAVVLCPRGGQIGLDLLPETVLSARPRASCPSACPRTARPTRSSSRTTSAASSARPCAAPAASRSAPRSCCKIKPTTLHEIIKRSRSGITDERSLTLPRREPSPAVRSGD